MSGVVGKTYIIIQVLTDQCKCGPIYCNLYTNYIKKKKKSDCQSFRVRKRRSSDEVKLCWCVWIQGKLIFDLKRMVLLWEHTFRCFVRTKSSCSHAETSRFLLRKDGCTQRTWKCSVGLQNIVATGQKPCVSIFQLLSEINILFGEHCAKEVKIYVPDISSQS
jgi:hypothetical protein